MRVMRNVVQTANKDYKCDYCDSNIFKGEGLIYDWRYCDHCNEIVKAMFEADDGRSENGLNDQDFRDYISENNIDFELR